MAMQGELRNPLGRAKGLGSAKDGTHHFWVQRVTAIALIPLALWFGAAMIRHADDSFEQAHHWLSGGVAASLMVLFLATAFYHLKLGLQIVIEDYVHTPAVLLAAQIANILGCTLFAFLSIFSVLKIAFGG